MAQASSSIDLPYPADHVWQLIGGFGSLPDWLPFIPKSELTDGGRIRHLATPDGDEIVERLIAFDHAARSYSYAILKAPFPAADSVATLKVIDQGGTRCKVEWSGIFTPKGVSDSEVSQLFQGIYDDGLKALAQEIAKKK
jgi:hypothetical protein